MKNTAIVSGNFSANGNFSGYDALDVRYHIRKAQMDSLGFTKQEDVKFPFYAVTDLTKINPRDEKGELMRDKDGNPIMVDRLTAKSVFKTKEDLINARADIATLDAEIAVAVNTRVKSVGLDATQLTALQGASL